ncbi:MAG: hypothetical protein JWP74_3287 [Marmoricola sp.]|nr:hypothetical protein [Marmoricola sp.]
MPRRPHLRYTVATTTLLLVGALSGCGGGSAHVGSFDAPRSDRAACRALLTALPAKVDGKRSRTTSGSRYAAAWGNPAIVLRCGVGVPAGFNKFSACQRADGVDWFVPDSAYKDQQADVILTTVGRSPRLDLLVPGRDRPPLAAMVDLAATIKAHSRSISPCD